MYFFFSIKNVKNPIPQGTSVILSVPQYPFLSSVLERSTLSTQRNNFCKNETCLGVAGKTQWWVRKTTSQKCAPGWIPKPRLIQSPCACASSNGFPSEILQFSSLTQNQTFQNFNYFDLSQGPSKTVSMCTDKSSFLSKIFGLVLWHFRNSPYAWWRNTPRKAVW